MCPSGSYDANVEPAKDDVLFQDPNQLLSVLEGFFKSVYGELQIVDEKKTRGSKPQAGSKNHNRGFELLLARKPQSIGQSMSPEVDIPRIQIGADEDHGYVHQSQSLVDGDQNIVQDEPSLEANDLAIDTVTTSHLERAVYNGTDPKYAETGPEDHLAADGDPPSKRRRTWHFNMYGSDEEDPKEPDGVRIQPLDYDPDTEEGLRDIEVSNPWTFAKMNAPVRRVQRAIAANGMEDFDGNSQLMTPAPDSGQHTVSTKAPKSNIVQGFNGSTASNLPTPQRTLRSPSPNPELISPSHARHFPSKAWGKAQTESASTRKQDQTRERYGAGALDTWVQKSLNVGQRGIRKGDTQLPHEPPEDEEISLIAARQQVPNKSNDFISARALQQGTPLRDIPEAPLRRAPCQGPRKRQQQQQEALHKPFISPVNDPHRVWFEMEPPRRAKAAQHARSKNVRDAIAVTPPIRFESENEDIIDEISPLKPTTPASPTLERLMDYEHRKRAATQEYRASLLNQANLTKTSHPNKRGEEPHVSSSNSPHKNRYEAARAALSPSKDDANNAPQVFADGDPRAYLIRVQRREDAARRDGSGPGTGPGQTNHKLRRAKTTMLPLETIAVGQKVQDLVFNFSTDVPCVKKLEAEAGATDDYVRSGENTCGLLATIEDIRGWEQRLSTLIEKTYKNETGERAKMSFDVWPALQEHMATHA